jgi:hypothetical protein
METLKKPKGNAAVGTPKRYGSQTQGKIKVRKAAGITSESDRDTEATKNAAAFDPAGDLPTVD